MSLALPGAGNAVSILLKDAPALSGATEVVTPQYSQPRADTVRAPTIVQVTNCNDDGAGSLRVVAAAAASGATVDMSQLTCSTITLGSGAVYLTQQDLTLHGPGRGRLSIVGNYYGPVHDGVLRHIGAGTLTVEGVSIRHGRKYTSSVDARGGCLFSEGSIVLASSSVAGCRSEATGSFSALGGGIFSGASTTVRDSAITGNTAAANGTGAMRGGGIYTMGDLTVERSWISYNLVSLQSPTVSVGGGTVSRGNLTITQSAITGNKAGRSGGVASMPQSPSTVFLSNSTIANNSAYHTGGMYTSSDVTLRHVTIANNTSHTALDDFGANEAAGLHVGLATVTLEDTLIADNLTGSGDSRTGGGASMVPSDLGGRSGSSVMGEHNLVLASFLSLPTGTLILPPKLGPLRDNGGTTPTLALLATSPAIDANPVIPIDSDQFLDQRGRGFRRYVSGHGGPSRSDIGAYELDPDRIFTTGMDIGVAP